MIFSLLSAILHLGNLLFVKDPVKPESAFIKNEEVLDIVSELLSVEREQLESSLTNRNMSARAKSVYTIPLSAEEVFF